MRSGQISSRTVKLSSGKISCTNLSRNGCDSSAATSKITLFLDGNASLKIRYFYRSTDLVCFYLFRSVYELSLIVSLCSTGRNGSSTDCRKLSRYPPKIVEGEKEASRRTYGLFRLKHVMFWPLVSVGKFRHLSNSVVMLSSEFSVRSFSQQETFAATTEY